MQQARPNHVIASWFTHRASPQTLFPPTTKYLASNSVNRFIRTDDSNEFLIYTDGACSNNGRYNPRGGCAFVFGPDDDATYCFPLAQGPVATSNRAELKAALAALQYRNWDQERFDTLVIATDSAYVAKVATTWCHTWLNNGWRTAGSGFVANRDLWEELLDEITEWYHRGLQVKFWQIPRGNNLDADAAAKWAAQN